MSSQPVGSSPEGEAGVALGDGELAPAGGVDGGGDPSEIIVKVDIAWLSPGARDYIAACVLDALDGRIDGGTYTLRWG